MAGFSQTVRRLPNLNLQWLASAPLSSCCRSRRLAHSSPRANPLSTQKEVPEGVINFSVGTPGKSLIPKKLVDDAMTEAIAQNEDPFMYQVGAWPCVMKIHRHQTKSDHSRAAPSLPLSMPRSRALSASERRSQAFSTPTDSRGPSLKTYVRLLETRSRWPL